jgi:ABC-type transport system involved in cytochrome bd biosynthesis fused ATPase/permease subunit
MVQTYAQNEQNMNAVERVLVYTELPAEGALTTPQDPPASWPPAGEIQFENVELAYRKGLPLVLKGVTFHVRPGEKIGIVGRTGAGQLSGHRAHTISMADRLDVSSREELPDTGFVQDGRVTRWFDCH